jgi:hypothetical protein
MVTNLRNAKTLKRNNSMKKKSKLFKIGMILTSIGGTILTTAVSIGTLGLATPFVIPAYVTITASVIGAIGTGMIKIDSDINKEE